MQLSPIAKKNGAKTVTVYGAGATTKLITELAKNAKYSVRIRTFKKIGNHNYFSSWSDSIVFKTKWNVAEMSQRWYLFVINSMV